MTEGQQLRILQALSDLYIDAPILYAAMINAKCPSEIGLNDIKRHECNIDNEYPLKRGRCRSCWEISLEKGWESYLN